MTMQTGELGTASPLALETLGLQESCRLLGTAALNGAEVSEYAELPADFHFAGANTIDPAELAALMQTVEAGQDITTSELIEQFNYFDTFGFTSVEIGVRSNHDEKLVGYGTLIVELDKEGELGDFVVNPAYQSRGVGKAIIGQRLLQAEKLGVRNLYIAPLEPTNTLKRYYLQCGFTEQPDGSFIRSFVTD